jgi:ParB family chromosome partitioning protein
MAKEAVPKRRALGRGIDALIRDELARDEAPRITHLSPHDIVPNRYQPRHDMPEESLAELAESIRTNGVIQPITVRRTPTGFELVVGERRLRASIMAGLETIPAIVRDIDDDAMLPLALVENIQREDLDPIERAEAYKILIDDFGLRQEDLASRMGLDRATIANTLRLLKLPKEIQRYLSEGRITTGHAKALLSLQTTEQQKAACRRIINEGLSVREAEELAGKPPRKRARPPAPSVTPRDIHLETIEEELQRLLGTRVRVTTRGDKGKIEIEFYSEEDLDRILEVFEGVGV